MLKRALLCFVGLLALALVVPLVHAETYSGSFTVPIVYPTLKLDVAIDTDTNTWTFTWEGSPALVIPPSGLLFASWEVLDDYGNYTNSHRCSWSGTVTFHNYTNRGTWARTLVKWSYIAPFLTGVIIYNFDAGVPLYIAPTPIKPNYGWGAGGGGHGCFYK